jgi:plastocyanin
MVQLAMVLGIVASAYAVPIAASNIETASNDGLPIVYLDAIDSARWSVDSLTVAPGQTIRITNRGVAPHTFVVAEWGVRIDLPTLKPVDVVVPDYVIPDDVFEFFCDEPGHAVQGQTGTIAIVSPETAKTDRRPGAPGTPAASSISLETNDDLTWNINELELAPGQILQVRNTGVIEHHFVVDEWGINETISSGEVRLVLVPSDVQPGDVFTFYCSIPGHRAAGMEGTITITESTGSIASVGGPGSSAAIRNIDIQQFVPNADIFGSGWSEVRSGNVRSIVPQWSEINVSVFPGDGIGVVFVGPAGGRAAVAVLPLQTTSLPTNQVQAAIDDVQFALMDDWNTNSTSNVNLEPLAPPAGCTSAQRATGVTGMHTLPAGLTVCQVRNANVAIFVTVEGEIDGLSGAEASDQIITRLLDRFGPS